MKTRLQREDCFSFGRRATLSWVGLLITVAILSTVPVGPALSSIGCWWNMDFDADARVDLDDFFLLADHFGMSSEDPGWDPTYDLNGDSNVSMDEVFIFADWWPTPGYYYQPGDCGGSQMPRPVGLSGE